LNARLLVFLCLLTALVLLLPGWPESTKADCPGAPLPIIIKSPGCFRVLEDYSTQEPNRWAIQVEAPDVLIDLDGHTIAGSGQTSMASGVYALNSPGLRVRGGAIHGFLFGVRAENTSGTVEVSDMSISGGARGVMLQGDMAVVRNNSFADMLGYSGWPAAHTIAIEVLATKCRVEGNEIRDIYAFSTGEIIAVSLSAPAHDCVVQNNTIANADRPELLGRGIAFWLTGTQTPDGAKVAENRVEGYDYAFMADEESRPAFAENEFIVTCLPGEVTTYDGGLANDFQRFGTVCRDSLPYLREKASGGNPEWRIRLAVALMEYQQGYPEDEVRCVRAAEAVAILTPLMDMQQAFEQMRRVEGINARCLAR
jgi:hypothetical protein